MKKVGSTYAFRHIKEDEYEVVESYVILDNTVNLCKLKPLGYYHSQAHLIKSKPRCSHFITVDGKVLDEDVVKAYLQVTGRLMWDCALKSKADCVSRIRQLSIQETKLKSLCKLHKINLNHSNKRMTRNFQIEILISWFEQHRFTFYKKPD